MQQRSKLALSSALAVVGLVFLGWAVWQGGYFVSTLAVVAPAAVSTSIPSYTTQIFTSRNGYALTYPASWLVDDTRQEAPAEFIREPSGKAFVAVQFMIDERLKDRVGRQAIYDENEQALRSAPSYTISEFDWEIKGAEGAAASSNSYMAMGSYVEQGVTWRFREMMIFHASGYVSSFRGAVLAGHAKEYGPVVDQIIFSFKPKK